MIDISKIINSPCSIFIICTASSSTHINAIANSIKNRTTQICNDEGSKSNWRLLDYMDIVVHILTKEKREFYNLEDLWNDGEINNLS